MNRERAKELLPIIQAFIEGKTIQYKSGPTTWEDVTNKMYPSIIESEYRIKPEPREFWIFKPNMRAYEDRQIGPNPEDDDEYFKVREIIE